ncbi:polysaccharide biosynthesis tyrosine autokinase [Flavobacterium faecale]|uniref:exopolysaccharide transport family protein n=1 Tax=Flavobacterium faecale TaxID=1355330 RepID=UPI003AAE06E9
MDFKKEFLKYFQYWPWILVSLLLSVGAAYVFIKTADTTYQTAAVINIDKKQEESAKISPFSKDYEKKKEIDLQDEIALATSTDLLSKAVNNLNLNINYFEKHFLHHKLSDDIPFVIHTNLPNDSLPDVKYEVKVVNEGFFITNTFTSKTYLIHGYNSVNTAKDLPFTIQLTPLARKNVAAYLSKEYVLTFESTTTAVNHLKSVLNVQPFEDTNTHLRLTHVGTDPVRSRKILDEIISLLDKNIVFNKQKMVKSKIDYLNQRIAVFLKERDSIQGVKEKYLKNNDILVLDKFIADKTNVKNVKKENSMLNARQIELTKFAINDIKRTPSTSALGTGYNLEMPTVNQLITAYNASILESQLILQRAQKNNPTYVSLQLQLAMQKQVILNSLEGYLNTLYKSNAANQSEQYTANIEARSIPTKDKDLGNINTNINLKEEIYLDLLQKREEAILNSAILASNLTTVSPPQTNYSAIFPQPKSFMLGAFLFGLLIPLGIIFLSLLLDSKIYSEDDIAKEFSHIPFLGILPKVDDYKKIDNSPNSRTVLAEASRILFSNLGFLLPRKNVNTANVLLFTSAIQGEGKSFCAFHMAATISNLNKKVLLIGADLRNPQLDSFFSVKKNELGLTNYLSNKADNWRELLVKDPNLSDNLDTIFSGEISPNPTQLLSNSNFQSLIDEAKPLYDFIIIDSAPVQLVSDTLNFSHLADVTLFVLRYNYTDKRTLTQINNFIKKDQLKNVGVLINSVSSKGLKSFTYGASYGYQYTEKKEKKSWLKGA